jgi:hypothetical protein
LADIPLVDAERDVARPPEEAQLLRVGLGEIAVVADGREQSCVRGQRPRREGAPLLDDRMHELDRHVQSVA